jgi:hypothetical protein
MVSNDRPGHAVGWRTVSKAEWMGTGEFGL